MRTLSKLLIVSIFLLSACSKDEDNINDLNSRFLGEYSGVITNSLDSSGVIQTENFELSFSIVLGSAETEVLMVTDEGSSSATIDGDLLIFASQTSEVNGITNNFSGEGKYYIDPNTKSEYLRLDFYAKYVDETVSMESHSYGDMKKK